MDYKNDTVESIVSSAKEVHRVLGEGCSEATYHRALEHEFSNRQITFSSEGTIPIFYKGTPVGKRRPDMFVESDEGTIVVELKAGNGRGEEQLFNYMDILSDDLNFTIIQGILIRFNEEVEVVIS